MEGAAVTITCPQYEGDEARLIRRLTQANAEAAELVAELEESKEQLERSNQNLAAANARSAELVVELQERREELEWANASLKEAFEENKRLARITAHDVRSGVAAIVATAEVLCDALRKHTCEGLNEANLIYRESRHMLECLESLLGNSCTYLGQIKIRPKNIDLTSIVQDARDAHEGLASQKLQTIEISGDGKSSPVFADPIRIRHVLDNLLSNAIKFSPQHAHITIEIRRLDDFAQVSVTDEGPGLTNSDLEKVFLEFTQLSAKPTGNEPSHGLGLSIVKKIIELHGGQVCAENRTHGLGARFSFTLPIPAESTGAWRILAVDDQALNRHVLKRLLEKSGHTVETCRNGLEAVEAVKGGHFDIIFMDVEMPEMSGVEASKVIRSTGRDQGHLPIIAVTAHTDASHLSQCMDSGMNDAIQKPINKELLDRAVTKWVLRAPR
jgi:signal transduction histidine kinase